MSSLFLLQLSYIWCMLFFETCWKKIIDQCFSLLHKWSLLSIAILTQLIPRSFFKVTYFKPCNVVSVLDYGGYIWVSIFNPRYCYFINCYVLFTGLIQAGQWWQYHCWGYKDHPLLLEKQTNWAFAHPSHFLFLSQ